MLHVSPRCSPRVEAALLRLLPEHERLVATRPDLPTDAVFYTALFARGEAPRLPPDLDGLLSEVCAELLGVVYGPAPARVLTAGFVEAPVGCRPHLWHFDYGGLTENVFVPLTPVTAKNGTEYVEWAAPASATTMLERYIDLFSLWPQHDLSLIDRADAHRVVRFTAQPFEVVRMPHYLLHRGAGNDEPYVRRMFYAATTLHPSFDLTPADRLAIRSWGL